MSRRAGVTQSVVPPIAFRAILCGLSASGCRLHLGTRIRPGSGIEIRCDISGIGLRIRGEVVWAEETGTGVYHGIALTGHESEEDAPFHRLYIQRLARQAEGAA